MFYKTTDEPPYYSECTFEEFVELIEGGRKNFRVGRNTVGDVTVSTVFLGINHNWLPDGPPALWETMIFGGRFSDIEYQERYTTKDEAKEGHERACKAAFGDDYEGTTP